MQSQLIHQNTSSSDNSKTIGFSGNQDYIVQMPRLWFPKEIPAGLVDESKILIVPDKGSKHFIVQILQRMILETRI